MNKFHSIDYLIKGNDKQKKAYHELLKLKIFENLEQYSPLLAGTIPLQIDLPHSDLDIICKCTDHKEFMKDVSSHYQQFEGFSIHQKFIRNVRSTIIKFKADHFDIEVFGQDIPVDQQYAYRHMIIEYKILQQKNIKFKKAVINLKASGYVTEAAFAKLLGLDGDPFEELLKIEL